MKDAGFKNGEPVSRTCRQHGDYTAREWELTDGSSFFSPCPKCREEMERAEQEKQEKSRLFKFQLQLSQAGIGRRFYNASFDNYRVSTPKEEHVLSVVRSYAERFTRTSPNLIMYGNTGYGKTHLGCALAADLIRRGFTVEYLPILNLFSRFQDIAGYGGKGGQREEFFAQLRASDLLIIDEFGITSMSDDDRITLHRVIDERYNKTAPIALIGNMGLKEFSDAVGERAFRRVMADADIAAFTWEQVETGDLFEGECEVIK